YLVPITRKRVFGGEVGHVTTLATVRGLSTPSDGGFPARGPSRARIVLLSAFTGIATGLVVAAFESVVVDLLQDWVFGLPLWAAAVLPVVGLVLAAVALRIGGRGVGPGTADEYLRAFHEPAHRLTARALVARMAGAVATLGSGGP